MIIIKQIQNLSYRTLLTALIITSLVSVLALRHNNQHMIKLRSTVYEADRTNGDVEKALDNLRSYVYAHMNTDLSSGGNPIKPPIQLKYTYERLQSAAEQGANTTGLYTEAENYCEQVIPGSVSFYGAGRIGCVQQYILSHGGKSAPKTPAALYEFDFVSPAWSPDLAGWTLVLNVLILLLLVTKFTADRLKA
jgi:hypothetical protein